MELLDVIKIQFSPWLFIILKTCSFSSSFFLQITFSEITYYHIQGFILNHAQPWHVKSLSNSTVYMGYEKSEISKVQLPVLMRPWTPTRVFSIILDD